MLGEGSARDRDEVVEQRGNVQFKVQTEQIYASFTALGPLCDEQVGRGRRDVGPGEGRQEALKKKQAVQWDPYAMDDEDDEDEPIVKRKKSKKKKAEEAKKKEEEEDDLDDEDIDW